MNIKQMKEISMADSPNWMDKFQNMLPEKKMWTSYMQYENRVRYVENVPYSDTLDRDLKKYRGFNSVLSDLLRENGGYIRITLNTPPSKPIIQHALDWYEMNYNEIVFGWEEASSEEGVFHFMILLYWLWQKLDIKVRQLYRHLKDVGKLPEDVIPAWELEETSEQGESDTKVEEKNKAYSESKMHITMDKKEARAIYNALRAKDVDWLADENLDLKSFMNILTLPPSGKKIKLRQLNQIHFLTRNYLFPPEEGKKTRRMTPEEWDLIKQLFDSEDGDVLRVDRANKKPKNFKIFSRHINSAGIKR